MILKAVAFIGIVLVTVLGIIPNSFNLSVQEMHEMGIHLPGMSHDKDTD